MDTQKKTLYFPCVGGKAVVIEEGAETGVLLRSVDQIKALALIVSDELFQNYNEEVRQAMLTLLVELAGQVKDLLPYAIAAEMNAGSRPCL
ncbi:MAG TPA: hypothetical protein VEC35_01435 [Noviherbaspirillum sp.]|nr:hypothetical protein [Noviherbaspirillum sp.]